MRGVKRDGYTLGTCSTVSNARRNDGTRRDSFQTLQQGRKRIPRGRRIGESGASLGEAVNHLADRIPLRDGERCPSRIGNAMFFVAFRI